MYQKTGALGYTAIKQLAQSYPHYLAWLDEKESTRSDSLIMGSLVDAMLMQPSELENYPVIPDGLDLRTKDGKAWGESIKQTKGEHIYNNRISQENYQHCVNMVEEILAHPTASRYFNDKAFFQYRVEAYLKPNGYPQGVLCRATPDMFYAGIMADLKTCNDASLYTFNKVIYDRGYDLQQYLYREVFKIARESNPDIPAIVSDDHHIVAIENHPPYGITIHHINAGQDNIDYQEGKDTIYKAIATYLDGKIAEEMGEKLYPYNPSIINYASKPSYMRRQPNE